jgi:hypothetical protein
MKYQDVVNSWNAQADEFNQWTELCSEEMVDYAIKLERERLSSLLQKEGAMNMGLCIALSLVDDDT